MSKSNILHLRLKTKRIIEQKYAQLSTGSEKASSVIASGVIASTLAMVLALNYQMARVSQNEILKGGRSPASLVENESASSTKLSTENLAKILSEKWKRHPASYGSASRVDQLRAGYFGNNYSVVAKDGKVWEVHFSEGEKDRPKYVLDKEEFLVRYKDVIGPDFQKPVLLEEKVVSGEMIAKYQLVGPTASAVAEITFVSDESDRLLSFVVKNEPTK